MFTDEGGGVPGKTGKTSSVDQEIGFAGFAGAAWPPRPVELAHWPIERRERWGWLANQHELDGVPFPESERRAFDLIKTEMEAAS
jgi:hypothetical protein